MAPSNVYATMDGQVQDDTELHHYDCGRCLIVGSTPQSQSDQHCQTCLCHRCLRRYSSSTTIHDLLRTSSKSACPPYCPRLPTSSSCLIMLKVDVLSMSMSLLDVNAVQGCTSVREPVGITVSFLVSNSTTTLTKTYYLDSIMLLSKMNTQSHIKGSSARPR